MIVRTERGLLWYGIYRWFGLVFLVVEPGEAQLVGPGAVTTFGGGGSRSRGGYAMVREPAAGFFIAGSSLKDMNGVYRRVAEDGIDDRRSVSLAYRNKFTGWVLAMVDPPEDAPYDVVGSSSNEWLLIDPTHRDRFGHQGRTFVPGSGLRWKHLHRSFPFDGSQTSSTINDEADRKADVAIAEIGEQKDDNDELPWQVVYIGDPNMVDQLERSFASYSYIIQQSLEFNTVRDEKDGFKRIGGGPELSFDDETQPPDVITVSLLNTDVTEDCISFYRRQLDVEQISSWHWAMLAVELSQCYRRLRQVTEAISVLSSVLGVRPSYLRARALRAVCYLDNAEPELALQDLEAIFSVSRDFEGLGDLLVRGSADLARKERAGKSTNPDNFQLKSQSSEDHVSRSSYPYNHYLWLEIQHDFDLSDLKRAYRKLSKVYHPDVMHGSSAVFEVISTAYSILGDEKARREYDQGSDLDAVDVKTTFKEKILRKYFPETFGFEPFGDPLANRKRQEEHERARNKPPPQPNAKDIPEGTYRRSCKGCYVANNGSSLICTHCTGMRGATHNTSIELESCSEEQQIGNNNGQLVCEMQNESPLPKGTYQETCKRCHFPREGVLQCRCHTGQRYQRTALALSSCSDNAAVVNSFGQLACDNTNEAVASEIEEAKTEDGGDESSHSFKTEL